MVSALLGVVVPMGEKRYFWKLLILCSLRFDTVSVYIHLYSVYMHIYTEYIYTCIYIFFPSFIGR